MPRRSGDRWKSSITGGSEPTEGDAKEREHWEREHRLRGCGERAQGGLYVSIGTSPMGRSIEFFLVDPAIRWDGGQLRAPMLVPDEKRTYHVLLGIGKQHYPFGPDFIEEAKVMGVSKRVPHDFDPSKLEYGRSKFLLVHPRAILGFEVQADFECRTGQDKQKHRCTSLLWPASSLVSLPPKHEVIEEDKAGFGVPSPPNVRIRTPSVEYRTRHPFFHNGDPLDYTAGVVLSFPVFSFDFVNKKGGVPGEITDRFSTSGFKLECVPE